MTEQELHTALESRGYVKEHNGGGTFVYRKGQIVVSGADGDLPAPHWFCIGVYADWLGGDDPLHSFSDWSGMPGYSDLGGPLDFMATLTKAETLA